MVREATEADAQGIAEVHVAAWRAAYRGIVSAELLDELSVALREDFWRSALGADSQLAFTLVAGDPDGSIAGFCSVAAPSRDGDAGERTAEIAAAYVRPARWGSGVGRSVLTEALDRLRAGPWDDATLWVFLRNAQGRSFFARSGFRLDGAKGVHEASGVATARMRAPLAGA